MIHHRSTHSLRHTAPAVVALLLISLLVASPAAAEPWPSSDLLLPYFEVGIDDGRTTLFALGNLHDRPVTVDVIVYSNWGIRLVETSWTQEAGEVRTVNLRDWLIAGQVPDKAMDATEMEHVQAAFSGIASPLDNLYYGTEIEPGLLVGSVEFHLRGRGRPDVLWGDFFIVDPDQDYAQGDTLINIDRASRCPGLCLRHVLRFLDGGGFDGGTQLVVWSGRRGQPSRDPAPPRQVLTAVESDVFDEPGALIDHHSLDLLSSEVVTVRELGLSNPFGWLDLSAAHEIYIGVRYSADQRFSVGLQAFCRRLPPDPDPRIRIEKATNGQDADQAPGPSIDIGDPVDWTYVVTNTGPVALSDVVVSDDQGVAVSCPSTELDPGESMTCTGSGFAEACQYRNVGRASGLSPTGAQVSDTDPSHYYGGAQASIRIEKSTNGHDADQAPGPSIPVGDAVSWTYRVTNTGDVDLTQVAVSDDQGVSVSCPRSQLAPGESMTCTGSGTAELGLYRNVGTATGRTPCGETVGDSDPSHYTGTCSVNPSIRIEKATNGHDADHAPGPTIPVGDPVSWTYRVTNTGDVALSGIAVSDDQGVSVSCPRTALAAGAAMTCTGNGVATAGQYRNVGTATGSSGGACAATVSDSDPSHYFAPTAPDPGSIGDYVWYDANANGIDDEPASAGIGGVRLVLTGAGADGSFGTADDLAFAPQTTNAAGGYLFTALEAGRYRVDVVDSTVPDGLALTTGNDPMIVDLGPGEDFLDADFGYFADTTGCGPCDGKVDQLTMRYLGGAAAQVDIYSRHGFTPLFSGLLSPGAIFSFVGTVQQNTMGPEIEIYVNGSLHTTIHTSCSQPIYPGLVSGSFMILAGSSRNGGPLCPL